MAVTGLVLLIFVIAHLAGNLQVFLGAEQLNNYAALLRRTPELLWPARLGLLAALVLHLVSSVKIVTENRRARPALTPSNATSRQTMPRARWRSAVRSSCSM